MQDSAKSSASHDFFKPMILAKGLESFLHAKSPQSSLGNEKITGLFRTSQQKKMHTMTT